MILLFTLKLSISANGQVTSPSEDTPDLTLVYLWRAINSPFEASIPVRQENNKEIKCVTTKDAFISKIFLGRLSLALVIKAVVQCSNHIQMQGKQPSVVRLHGCISYLSCCCNKLPHDSNRRERGSHGHSASWWWSRVIRKLKQLVPLCPWSGRRELWSLPLS